jgi:hypothetical protein
MKRKGHLLELAMSDVNGNNMVNGEGKRRRVGEEGTWVRS